MIDTLHKNLDQKKIYMICGVVLVLACVAELMGVHMHSPHWWPLPFGFDIFFGFVGCWILIFLAKIVMMQILQREPDYYGGDDDE